MGRAVLRDFTIEVDLTLPGEIPGIILNAYHVGPDQRGCGFKLDRDNPGVGGEGPHCCGSVIDAALRTTFIRPFIMGRDGIGLRQMRQHRVPGIFNAEDGGSRVDFINNNRTVMAQGALPKEASWSDRTLHQSHSW